MGTNFTGANLEYADFINANMELSTLAWANFEGAKLDGANLDGAYRKEAYFLTNNQLSKVKSY